MIPGKNRHKLELMLLVFLIFGGLCDTTTKHIGKSLIYVEEGYLGSLFEVVCTVAVLGNAILSIIIGIAEQKVLGIPFQKTFKITGFGNHIFHSVTVTLFTIILSVCAYAFEAYTTITFLLVFVVVVIGISSVKIWHILSDEEAQKNFVQEVMRNSQPADYATYIGGWFQHLQTAISLKDPNGINRYLSLIEHLNSIVTTTNSPLTNCIDLYLPNIFKVACESYDFICGYKLIDRINQLHSDTSFENETIICDYIREIKYSSADKIGIRNMKSTVDKIIQSNEIPYDVKWIIIHELVYSLNNNNNLTNDDKKERLGSIMKCLCCLRDEDNEELKIDILLTIFREEVLLKEDTAKREWLHLLIIENLVSQNIFENGLHFIRVISEMFRALFFYVHFETETLSQSYRNDLAKLSSISVTSRDAVKITLSLLIYQNRESIATWLAENALAFKWRESASWDYYPRIRPFKRAIWERENILRFAYCYCIATGSICGHSPIIATLQSMDIPVDNKLAICKIITEQYSGDKLSDEAIELINKISLFLTGTPATYDFYDNREYKSYQDMLLNLKNANNMNSSTDESFSKKKLTDKVCGEINQDHGLHIIFKKPNLPFTKQHLEPHFIQRSSKDLNQSAYYISSAVQRIINGIVDSKLSQVEIGFNEDGIRELLNQLISKKHVYRNYTYINDLAFKVDALETEEYQKLRTLINSIEEDVHSNITSRVFLTVPKICCEIEMDYCTGRPTRLQCSQFIQAHEISDGCYQIDGYRLDYVHAMQFLHDNYEVEYITLKIHVDVNEKTGLKICFKR